MGALILLLVAGGEEVRARTITVSPGPLTIHDAIAQAGVGDTVALLPGHYLLDRGIGVPGGIVIRSIADPIETIVDLQYNWISVFTIKDASPPPTVEGLTIAHGLEVARSIGGGFFIQNSSPIIQDNLIVANANAIIEGCGGGGCGIGVFNGNPIVRRNTLVGNHCANGAILLIQSSAIVEHNVITYTACDDTTTTVGYGIDCSESPNAIVRENVFWANVPTDIHPDCTSLEGIDSNIELDPMFCDVVRYPRDALLGDWRVLPGSPLAPGGPYEGWGAPLGVCDATPTQRATTWGRLKVRYR